MFYHEYQAESEYKAWALKEKRKIKESQEAEYKEKLEKEQEDSFYQKLMDGYEVRILIVGDSIGAGSGVDNVNERWPTLLEKALEERFDVLVDITNVSLGGNTSYAGYVRTKSIENTIDYDLVVICYGENDLQDDFSLYYESIIRAIKDKFPGCSLLSILESSQREYTKKIKEIQRLADYYGYPIVDTITPFIEQQYDSLTEDGIHPNAAGQKIYSEEILDVIVGAAENYKGKDPDQPIALNSEVRIFDTFQYISVEEFERVDDLTYQVPINISGIMGIDYNAGKSNNKKVEIYIDEDGLYTINKNFSQRHILIVSNNCEIKKSIRIMFGTKEATDGFCGLCFSNINN